MSDLLVLLVSGALVAAFILGQRFADSDNRRYWRTHDYCPTCGRFSEDHPVNRLRRSIAEAKGDL